MSKDQQSNNYFTSLKSVLKPIFRPLEELEVYFFNSINSEDKPIQDMINYVFHKKGKLLRPSLVFLCSRIWKSSYYKEIIHLALSIEMIHIATLIHDDVNDRSELRRGIKTYHQKWGASASVLFGDFLFSHAFIILARLGNLKVIENLSETTSWICNGEIKQNFLTKKGLSEEEINIDVYLDIVKKKTACLIGESCRISSVFTGESEEFKECLYQFGINLGMAFQIYDDYLDFQGDMNILGKPTLKDLDNNYLTLPMIYRLDEWSGDRTDFYNYLKEYSQKKDGQKELQRFFKESLKKTLDLAKFYRDRAVMDLQLIKDEDLRNRLEEVAHFVIRREY